MPANSSKSEIILKLYSRLKQSPCTIAIFEDWKRKNGYTFTNRSLYRYLNELSKELKVHGETIEVLTGEYNKKIWKIVYADSSKELNVFDVNTFFLSKTFVPKTILKLRGDSFTKIENQLYRQTSKSKFEFAVDAHTLGMRSTGFFEAQYTKKQQEMIERVIWAIQNKRKIIIQKLNPYIDWETNRVGENHILLPVSLLNHRGMLRVCAFNESNQSIVLVGFETMLECELTNDIFKPAKYVKLLNAYTDSHFGMTQNISDKIYDIELEFDYCTGGYISNFFWHKSQKFTDLKNGKIRVNLRCGINGELVGWIIQWMSNVRVVKPAILKQKVNAVHQECIDFNNSKSAVRTNTFWK